MNRSKQNFNSACNEDVTSSSIIAVYIVSLENTSDSLIELRGFGYSFASSVKLKAT